MIYMKEDFTVSFSLSHSTMDHIVFNLGRRLGKEGEFHSLYLIIYNGIINMKRKNLLRFIIHMKLCYVYD